MNDGLPNPETSSLGDSLVAHSSRIVFSLLRAAVRVAAGFGMPLTRVVQLTQLAYFAELRRDRPRDLAGIAEQLGVSLRTAGTLNRKLRTGFFAPENEVEPMRTVTAALLGSDLRLDELVHATGLDEPTLARATRLLVEHGWVQDDGGVLRMRRGVRSFVAPDASRRIDGLNNQMDVLASSVRHRFAAEPAPTAAGRSWVFAAQRADFTGFVDETVAHMRHRAVDLEEAALRRGTLERYGVTIAFAPVQEER